MRETPPPIVFTAQSKHYFYCSDTVCEWVFERGKLPLNPFKMFGYFLGDRVDRDWIRSANNALIALCSELWVFGPVADGVYAELELAADISKPVRFFTIGSRKSEITPIPDVTLLQFEDEIHKTLAQKEELLRKIRHEPWKPL